MELKITTEGSTIKGPPPKLRLEGRKIGDQSTVLDFFKNLK